MKKLACLFLAIAFAITMAACQSGEPSDSNESTTATEEDSSETTVNNTEPDETEQPTDTVAPTESSPSSTNVTSPAVDSSATSVTIGNLKFPLASGMEAEYLDENLVLVTLKKDESYVIMFANDVSEMSIDLVSSYVSIQHKSFKDEDQKRYGETNSELSICNFDARGESYSTINDEGFLTGNLDLSFTDTWMVYTFRFFCYASDTDSAYDYSRKYGIFLSSAYYMGEEPREAHISANDPTSPPATNPPATEPPATNPPATEPPKPTEAGPTAGEQNALREAKNYLNVMPFSHDGLIEQLEYEGYTKSEATYAADHCGANWNEQALKSAKNYLDVMPFSYSGLIEQLEYEKYTTSQATYGADNCGADWFEQAAKSAKAYLDLMPFSRESLISQLEYEGFTHEQAVYGVEANGL